MSTSPIGNFEFIQNVPGINIMFEAINILEGTSPSLRAQDVLTQFDIGNFIQPAKIYNGPLYTHEWEFQLESEYVHVMSYMQFFIWLVPIAAVVGAILKCKVLNVYSAELNVYHPRLKHRGDNYFDDNKRHIEGLDNNQPEDIPTNQPPGKKGSKGVGGGAGGDSDEENEPETKKKNNESETQKHEQNNSGQKEEKIENIQFGDDDCEDVPEQQKEEKQVEMLEPTQAQQVQQEEKKEKDEPVADSKTQLESQKQQSDVQRGSKKLSGLLTKKQQPSHKNIDSLTGMLPSKNEVIDKANSTKEKAQTAAQQGADTIKATKLNMLDDAQVQVQKAKEMAVEDQKLKPFKIICTGIDDFIEKYLTSMAIHFFLFINIGSYTWAAFIFTVQLAVVFPINILGLMDGKQPLLRIIFHVLNITMYFAYFIVNQEMRAAGTDLYHWTFANVPTF